MNDHKLRTRINEESKIYPRVRTSLQTCRLKENEDLIRRAMDNMKDEVRKNHLRALMYILQTMLAQVPHLNGRIYTQSSLEFDVALDI